jgi:hypothetical protein
MNGARTRVTQNIFWGVGIMGDLIIRMQQNVGTYWILSIGELHSYIVFCIVEYANPFMSKYTTCIL